MVRPKDTFWQYVEDVEGHPNRFRCKFCARDFPGRIARVKSHLSKQPCRDIAACSLVPDLVQAAATMAITPNSLGKKRSRLCGGGSSSVSDSTSGHPSSSGPGTQTNTIPMMVEKKDKDKVDSAVAGYIVQCNCPFSHIGRKEFIYMAKCFAEYGPGYVMPSYSTLRTKLVSNKKLVVEDYLKEIKESWNFTGCTIVSDMWSDIRERSFMNVIACSPKGFVFLKSFNKSSERHTGTLISSTIIPVIEEVGPQNVVQIVTDNASNYESAARDILNVYPHIIKSKCAAHGINLLLKDIYRDVVWIKTIFDEGKKIVKFMYKHALVSDLMREYIGRELKKPCVTRFATNFLMLQSIIQVEDGLRQMVASQSFRAMNFSLTPLGRKVTTRIQSIIFWSEAREILTSLEPLVIVLRLVDGEEATSGYLYEAMQRARQTLKEKARNDPVKFSTVLELFEKRREGSILHKPNYLSIHKFHAAASYLNPKLMYEGMIKYESPDVRAGLVFILENLLMPEERTVFAEELLKYNQKHHDLFDMLATPQINTLSPRTWWELNGGVTPLLRKIAIRILSQPCSSSACERNWSAFEGTQTDNRNQLSDEMLNTLVYIRVNTIMMENFEELELKNSRIINLEKLGELLEALDRRVGEPGEESDNEDEPEDPNEWLDGMVVGSSVSRGF